MLNYYLFVINEIFIEDDNRNENEGAIMGKT